MLRLVICIVALGTLTWAGTCPDILSDPTINFLPSTDLDSGDPNDHDNIEFDDEFACGATSTGIVADSEGARTKDKTCRMKCKNWDKAPNGGVKLFWVQRRDSPWRRTKYMECKCNNVRCGYTRKQYNFAAQLGRAGYVGKIKVACDTPTCTHPGAIPELNAGGFPIEIRDKDDNVLCQNEACNVNTNRGGWWRCYNHMGQEIPNNGNAPLPRLSYCKLACSHNDAVSMKKKILCNRPHLPGAQAYRGLFRTFFQLNKGKWKNQNKHPLMSADDGWRCVDGV